MSKNCRDVIRKSVAIGLITLSAAVPALAILGIGDIVYDPTNFEEAVQQLAMLEQQYEQVAQTYRTVNSQYQQMLYMARKVPVDMKRRYQTAVTAWTASAPSDAFGTIGSWSAAIGGGQNVPSSYAAATTLLENYGSAFDVVPSDQKARIKTDYATVELTDGANVAGMQTIGDLRNHAASVETAIANLESDSYSPDPNMNTEVAVLNKINAAGMINLRSVQDTNKLLVAIAEEQIIQAKRERDAEAQAFSEHIRFMSEAKAAMAAQAQDASAAMLAFRMP